MGRRCIEALERRVLLSTYYVSTTGNDNNNGSEATPFATIQEAAKYVVAGDTVNVEAGTFQGFVLSWDNPQAGTAGSPITFQAAPGTTAGSVIINERNNKTPVAIDLEPGSDYVTIKGFTIENDGTVTNDGIKATGNNDSMIDNTVVGVGDFGIFTDNANDALIEDNNISGTLGTDTDGHGIYVSGTCTGVVIEGNTIDGNGWHGIHLNGDASEGGIGEVIDCTIEDNLIYNNPGNGINGDGLVDSIIENNVIYGYTNNGISLYQIDAGVGSTGNVIVNNTIDGGSAIELQDGATGNVVFNNIMTGTIFVDGTSSDTTSNNVTDSSDAALFINAAGGNYQLSSTSPAIGAGVSSFEGQSAPASDILGVARVNGRYDAGAYEYGTPNDTPSAPGEVGATQGNAGGVVISWQTATNATVYQVFRNTTNNSGAATKIAGSITTTSFTDTTATPGQTYYYWVRGRNSNSIGDLSAAATGFALGTPGSPLATPADGEVDLSWNSVTDATAYQIFRNTIDDGSTAVKVGASSGTSFDDTTADGSLTYYYWIRARNSSGFGNFTGEVNGYAAVLPAPSDPSASNGPLSGEVTVSWSSVSGASAYQVFRSTTDNINTAIKIAGGILTTSFLDLTTTSGQTYYYWIRARSPSGLGIFSGVASVTA
jgi:parallel beta-helix repeat protein